MMRFKDFRCKECGSYEEDVLEIDGKLTTAPRCCDAPMVFVPGAPLVAYKPHFSHALNRRVERYADEEKELAKKNQWIATKSEANRRYDTDHFGDDVTVQPAEQAKIRKTVEKAAEKLAKDGLMSPRPSRA